MEQFKLVNTGTSSNDGTGDPLRVALQKINGNFMLLNELISKIDFYLMHQETQLLKYSNKNQPLIEYKKQPDDIQKMIITTIKKVLIQHVNT